VETFTIEIEIYQEKIGTLAAAYSYKLFRHYNGIVRGSNLNDLLSSVGISVAKKLQTDRRELARISQLLDQELY